MIDYTNIGYIFLYVAAFGFSDYIVEKYKLFKNEIHYILYYILILIIGIIIIKQSYNVVDEKHQKKLK